MLDRPRPCVGQTLRLCSSRMAFSPKSGGVPAILPSKNWIVCARWLSVMGKPCCDAPWRPIQVFWCVAQHSPRIQPNKGSGQKLHLMARHGHCHWEPSQELCYVSRAPECSSKSTAAPVPSAWMCLVLRTCRLCWSYGRSHVPDASWCSFKIDGSCPSQFSSLSDYNWRNEGHFHHQWWSAGNVGHRQRFSLYQFWVPGIHQT